MTPKEKTIDIFYKYFEATKNHYITKECSLIAVDEILKVFSMTKFITNEKDIDILFSYYEEVKTEIEAL